MCIKFANCANISNEGGKKNVAASRMIQFNSFDLFIQVPFRIIVYIFSLRNIFEKMALHAAMSGQHATCNALTCGFDLHVSICA